MQNNDCSFNDHYIYKLQTKVIICIKGLTMSDLTRSNNRCVRLQKCTICGMQVASPTTLDFQGQSLKLSNQPAAGTELIFKLVSQPPALPRQTFFSIFFKLCSYHLLVSRSYYTTSPNSSIRIYTRNYRHF